ncbi:hypothetical protein [Senegalia massiliensis]|uniref:Uncharacterized protein n=1 Tax=Senegalia massiliensis TaxID=1720316 RepID=A0A845QZI4_9CLOT|nr:hypothetical protein [Senegalia massiliensis]NBI07580.1 hypothetical protein [Senegalia massiliensis]
MKFRKIIITFIIMMLITTISPHQYMNTSYGYSSSDNDPTNFYSWANSYLGTDKAYYVKSTDEIKFVSRGIMDSSAYYRWGTEGYQVRVRLDNGKVLWTIIPFGHKGFIEKEEISGKYIYTLKRLKWKSGSNSLMSTLKKEFVDTGKITQSELNTVGLGDIRFDAVFVLKLDGRDQGYLRSNGTISGNLYLTDGRYKSPPYVYDSNAIKFNNAVPRLTSVDKKQGSNGYTGMRGSAPWSSNSKKSMADRMDISVVTDSTDNNPPNLWYSPNSKGWTNQDVTVTIRASDDYGVDNVSYRYYKSGYNSGYKRGNNGTKVTFYSEGIWRITGTAKDYSGHSTSKTSGYYKIDKTDPGGTFSPNSSSWRNSNLTVNFNPSDSGGSGVYRWRYKVYKNGSWGNYSSYINGDTSKNITLSTEGKNRIYVAVYDNAGNSKGLYSGHYYIDKTSPEHYSHSITGERYRKGNDYWIRPNESVKYKMRGYDSLSGIRYSYGRFTSSGVDSRSQHDWNNSSTHNNHFMKSNYLEFVSANETYESGSHKEIEWTIKPKNYSSNYEKDYDAQYYYRDNAGNNVGYTDTGMNLRVDGSRPYHLSDEIIGARYIDENNYWVRQSDKLKIRVKGQDDRSGLKLTYLSLNNHKNRAYTYWEGNYSEYVKDSSDFSIPSGRVIDGNGAAKEYEFDVNVNTSQDIDSNVKYLYKDNVDYYTYDYANNNKWENTNKIIKVDNTKPSGTYSPTSLNWTNSNQTISFNPSDSRSGVQKWRYRLSSDDGNNYGSWSSWIIGDTTSNISLESEGTWKIQAEVIDNVGLSNIVTSGTYEIDQSLPEHISHSITGHRYKNSNDYWVQPNDTIKYKLRGYDKDSGIWISYARLYADGVDARSKHNWSNTSTHNDYFKTSLYIDFDSAIETYESSGYREVEWTIKTKENSTDNEKDYDMQYYYIDYADNHLGYGSTGMNLRIDNTKPDIHISQTEGILLPTDEIQLNASDNRSGVKKIQYKWLKTSSKQTDFTDFTTHSGGNNINKPSHGEGYYLHVIATDNVGISRYNVYGEYNNYEIYLKNYRITDMVNHQDYGYIYPIPKDDLFVYYKAGYYVTFRIDAIGDPQEVIAEMDINSIPDGNIKMKIVEDDGVWTTWEGEYYSDVNTSEGSMISTDITAYKDSIIYNYNSHELWDGEILKIKGNAIKDTKINRTN